MIAIIANVAINNSIAILAINIILVVIIYNSNSNNNQ